MKSDPGEQNHDIWPISRAGGESKECRKEDGEEGFNEDRMRKSGRFVHLSCTAGFTPWRTARSWGTVHIMKNTLTTVLHKNLPFCLLTLPFLLLASCDQQKAEINANKDATVDMIDQQKDAIDDAADAAKERAGENAEIDKANIEAEKETAKAQLDADKVKAEAEAEAAKARVDAVKQ